MIRVARGSEPAELLAERARRLPELRAIAATRPPVSKDFEGYGVAKPFLAEASGSKCWYCEKRVEVKNEPVEHYRPKTQANRGDRFPKHGYWWLALTWENLFFVCDDCNKAKGTYFPLDAGSTALVAEAAPPGAEIPLLIDPCAIDPTLHIEFVIEAATRTWRPRARGGSPIGAKTIEVLGLDGITKRPGIVDFFRDHVIDRVLPQVEKLREAMDRRDTRAVADQWDEACRKLLRRSNLYAALSYDARGYFLREPARKPWGLVIPRPPWEPGAAPIFR